MKIIFIFISICTLILSCQVDEKTKKDNNAKLNDLFEIDEYSIPLDSTTGFESHCLSYLKEGNKERLILFYKNNNKINIYDFIEKKMVKSIVFDKEGPNGVGNGLTGFCWVSDNEIYLYSYWDRKLYCVNSKKEVVKKFEIKDDGTLKYPVIDPNNNRKMIKDGNKIILAGTLYKTLPKNKSGKPFVAIDVNSGNYKLVGSYPNKIYEGDWDTKDETFFDYDESSKKFIVTFSMSDSVVITDLEKKKVQHYAGSSFLDEIKPLSPNYDNQSSSNDETYEYILSGTYWNIKYDRYRKLYYRFGILPRSLKDFQSAIPPKFFITVFDNGFKHLGETILSEGLYPPMAIVTPLGLLIPNKSKYDENENYLYFEVLSAKK